MLRILCVWLAAAALTTATVSAAPDAQQAFQQAYLKASNTRASDRFGGSVAVSGDTMVIANGIGNNSPDSGTAYVFVRSGTNWIPQASLKAPNGDPYDYYGYSVSISGDTIVVGAEQESSNATGVNGNQSNNSAQWSGAAYVFVRDGTNWTLQAYLKASNTDIGDRFGSSVAVSGNTIVVGAPGEASQYTGVNAYQFSNVGDDFGAAYVFVRSGTNWSQQAYIKASHYPPWDFESYPYYFGDSVAVSGDTVVIGAIGDASNATGVNGGQGGASAPRSGAAYVFARSGTTWSQQAYLKASNTGAGDRFGSSVAVSSNTVVVGAAWEDSSATGVNGNQNDNSAADSGAAYVFVRSGATWRQQAYLKASNTEAFDLFSSVAISGDTVVVGAYWEDSNATGVNGNQVNNSATDSGAAYVFVRNGTNWIQRDYLKASNTEAFDVFGSVGVSGDTVVVGAVGEDSNATGVNGNQSNNSALESGAAYVFIPASIFVTAQPTNQAVFTGSDATFSVSVTTTNPPLNFQWRFNGADLPGATNDSLIITNAQLANAGDYDAVVTDTLSFIRSARVSLSLLDAHAPTVATLPAIDIATNRATLYGTVNPNGGLTAAYFEYGLDTNYGSSAPAMNLGSSANPITVSNVVGLLPSVTYHFRMVATNSGGTNYGIDRTFTTPLSVDQLVEITAQPRNQSVVPTTSAVFSVSASSGFPLRYQWQFNNTDIPDATNFTITVAGAQIANVGNYAVVVANMFTSVTSSVARLDLLYPPTITQQPQPITVVEGDTATFTVTVTNIATLPIRYQWRKGTTLLANILSSSTNSSFTLQNVRTNATATSGPGDYQVAISNAATTGGAAIVSSLVALTVIPAIPPTITQQPEPITVVEGENATFTVTVANTATLPILYLWRKGSPSSSPVTNILLYTTNCSFTFYNVRTNVTATNGPGNYQVAISNAATFTTPGRAIFSSVVPLTIIPAIPPNIVQQPLPATVAVGENVTFTVTVTNTATLPITYTFRKGPFSIANFVLNSTTCSFTLYNVQTNVTATSGPGNYRVTIANAATAGVAAISSTLVPLTVTPLTPPSALTREATNIAAQGSTLTGSVNPNGATTLGYFDYGLTASYGNSTPAINLGNGTNSLAVTQVVTGLLPNTNYHFRLVASSRGGTNSGADMVFNTAGALTAPTLVAPSWQGNHFTVSVATMSGSNYYLERKTSLDDSDWIPVANLSGNGLVQTLTDPAATTAQAFYRLRVE